MAETQMTQMAFETMLQLHTRNNYRVIVTNSHYELGHTIAELLHLDTIDADLCKFSNGETSIKLLGSVRGLDLILVATGNGSGVYSLNDYLVEVMLLIHGCRTSSANSITVVMPYMPYSRADKRDHRGPISIKFVIDTLVNTGATRIVSMDLHAAQIQATTTVPFDNLYAIDVIIEHMRATLFKDLTQEQINERFVLASPDQGASKRLLAYAAKLSMNVVMMDKKRDYTKKNTVANVVVYGDGAELKGRTAIVIDDMMDTMGTMVKNVEAIMACGSVGVIAVATHAILSGPAAKNIASCAGLIKVIVTDTVPLPAALVKNERVQVVSIAPLFAAALNQIIIPGGSVSKLF